MAKKPTCNCSKGIHCCEQMKIVVDNPTSLLRYDEFQNGYFYIRKYTYAPDILNFCPWCLTKISDNEPIIKRKRYYYSKKRRLELEDYSKQLEEQRDK